MGFYPGSFRELANATPADIALVDASGNQITTLAGTPPSIATLTQVPAATSSTVILAANPLRKGVIITNASSKTLTVAFAATASTSAYTFIIASNGVYTGPLSGYTGIISGIWNGTSGNAQVTELS